MWGLLDPLIFEFISMASAAFCVVVLAIEKFTDPKYIFSFLATEISFIAGFKLAGKMVNKSLPDSDMTSQAAIPATDEFRIFLLLGQMVSFVIEVIALLTIGIVVLQQDVNHITAYEEHGVIRAFLYSSRSIVFASLLYKKIYRKEKYSLLDYASFTVIVLGVLGNGSKASILTLFCLFFTAIYPFIYQGKRKKFKINILFLTVIGLFPVIVIMLTTKSSFMESINGLLARFVASGDIFVLGYNDDVIKHIHEKSFAKYIFYPGFGTILKTIGIDIKPPEVIGFDISDYWYGVTTFGPNARQNFLGLYFLGYFWSVIYSFAVGFFLNYIRYIYKKGNVFKSYIKQIYLIVFITNSPILITDLNSFLNISFWFSFVIILIYLVTNFIYLVISNPPRLTLKTS